MKNAQNPSKEDIVTSLKKAHSQLDKVMKMTNEDAYCIDIMQQNLAVIGLLRSAHQKLLERHLQTCFSTALKAKNGKKKQAMMEEILRVTKISNK